MDLIKKIFCYISSFITSTIILIVRIYQVIFSHLLGVSCRYAPTCSEYMIESIRIHGLYGLLIGLKRIIRCNPLCGSGYDPVPKKKSSLTLKE